MSKKERAEFKHTSGPWHIDWNVSRLDICAEGRLIVSLRRSTKDGAPTHDDAEAVANARLIAAAPQLLEALQGAIAAWERLYPHMPVAEMFEDCEFREMGAVRAAIAAATGAQQ